MSSFSTWKHSIKYKILVNLVNIPFFNPCPAKQDYICFYTCRQINQNRMIFGDFPVNFAPIFLKFAELYLIFQKLDHLSCNKILELV